MSAPLVLVVGAQRGSLGQHVSEVAEGTGFTALEAGVAGEPVYLDVRDDVSIHRVLSKWQPEHIVCTAGINPPHEVPLSHAMEEAFAVNATGPMRLLAAFHAQTRAKEPVGAWRHFVAVSSNSAHVARSKSLAYCASKAALSMAIRCAAREIVRDETGLLTWCVEPGLLDGTPMTRDTEAGFEGALHRIPGLAPREGLEPLNVARFIVTALHAGGHEMNGVCLRLDGGEQ